MDSPEASLSSADSNATSQNAQESLSSQHKPPTSPEPAIPSDRRDFSHTAGKIPTVEENFPFSRPSTSFEAYPNFAGQNFDGAIKFSQPSTSFPPDFRNIQPPPEYIDSLGSPPITDRGELLSAAQDSLQCFAPDAFVSLQSPESTSCFRGSDSGSFRNPESSSVHEKGLQDEKCKNSRSLSVTFGPVDRRNMDKVRFSENGAESEDDYSASVSAIILRRTSSKRRSRSSFSPEEFSNTSRRRSSVFTTSSGDTGVSMEELEGGGGEAETGGGGEGGEGGGTDEQVVENIRLHKEVLTNVKQQPWSMRRKLKLVQQAKSYIKRHEGELQERLAQSRSTKDFLARFNILLVKEWQHTRRELANMMNLLIPWELRIKEIESHFGSAVASYFTFLRWLFWVNFILALVLILFVAIPELLSTPSGSDCAERKEVLPEERAESRKLATLFEFEGILKYSPIFYGYYTNEENSRYNIPLAFFIVTLVLYIYSFVAILKRMAANSKMSKLADKDDECVFTWKLFTGWDYMIGNAETAQNRTSSIILGFKEALVEEAEKQRDHLGWKIICVRIIVNVLVVFLLGVSAYSIIMVVERSQEPAARRTLWRKNEAVVVIWFIGVTFPRLLEKLGNFERLHPRKHLRMLLARIMVLQVVNLYTFFLEHLVETGNTIDELQLLKPKLENHSDHSGPPPTANTPLPNVTHCTYKIINCSLLAYFLASSSNTVTYLPTESIILSGIKDANATVDYQSTNSGNKSYTSQTFDNPTTGATMATKTIDETVETIENTMSTRATSNLQTRVNSDSTNSSHNINSDILHEDIQTTESSITLPDWKILNKTSNETIKGTMNITEDFDAITTRDPFEEQTTPYDVTIEQDLETFGFDESTIETDIVLNITKEEFATPTSSTDQNISEENETLYFESTIQSNIQIKDNITNNSSNSSENGEEIYDEEDDVKSITNIDNASGSVLKVSPVDVVNPDFEETLKNYDYALELSNETQDNNKMTETEKITDRTRRNAFVLVNENEHQDDLELFKGSEFVINETKLDMDIKTLINSEEKVDPLIITLIDNNRSSQSQQEYIEYLIRHELPDLDVGGNNEPMQTTFGDYSTENFTDLSNEVIEGDNPSEHLTPPTKFNDFSETTEAFENNLHETDTNVSSPDTNMTPGENEVIKTPGINITITVITQAAPNISQTSIQQTDTISSTHLKTIHNSNVPTIDNKIHNNRTSDLLKPTMLDTVNTTMSTFDVTKFQTSLDNVNHVTNTYDHSTMTHSISMNTISTPSSWDQQDDMQDKTCVIYECVPIDVEKELHKYDEQNFTSTLQTFIPKKPRSFCTKQLPNATRKKLRNLCWETKIGQELVKLTVVDLVSTIGLTILSDAGRALFVRYMNPCWCWDLEKTFPKYADFNIAENILGLVYNQGYVWIGMFFAPGLPLINLIKLMVLMYLNSWAVLTSNVPHEVVFRASRSNNFYLALLLLQLFLAVLPVGYTIVATEPSWHCGPFSGDNYMYDIFTRTIKRNLPASFHKVLDYLASPGTIIPLLILLILIIYYLASLTSALKEANIDLKIQLRRERTEERRKMYQLVARRKRTGEELLDSTLSKWREILPDTPVEKTVEAAEAHGRQTKEDLMMRFIHKTRRKASDTTGEKSDEDREHTMSPEQTGNGETRNAGRAQADKKLYQKRKSSSSTWSSDHIPEIKISASNTSDVAESDETDQQESARKAFQTGSTDTVIEINEPKAMKLDSPERFRTQRRLQGNGKADHAEKSEARVRKDMDGNGEKRHKKRKKAESTQDVREDFKVDRFHASRNLTEEDKHSPGESRKRVKKLSKDNLDKLQVQIDLEDDKFNPITRRPTESSSDVEEIDEKVASDRNRRKLRKDGDVGKDALEMRGAERNYPVQSQQQQHQQQQKPQQQQHQHKQQQRGPSAVKGVPGIPKSDSLEVETYRNLSREFISPKRKQLLKQLKYQNRRYQIYCDDVGVSRSLEQDCDQLGAPRQDEAKSKSLNHLLEHR